MTAQATQREKIRRIIDAYAARPTQTAPIDVRIETLRGVISELEDLDVLCQESSDPYMMACNLLGAKIGGRKIDDAINELEYLVSETIDGERKDRR